MRNRRRSPIRIRSNTATERTTSPLLATGGRETSALDLARAAGDDGRTRGRSRPDGLRSDAAGPAQAVPDEQALAAYHARLADLRSELDEARDDHDPERVDQLTAEVDFLAHELGSALGRHGRRRTLPTDAERAHISVTRARRGAIARIADVEPEIGTHLSLAVPTGTYRRCDPHRAARGEDRRPH